jgi:hypothetical protein
MPDTANKTKAESRGDEASKPTPRRPVRPELIWEGKYDADGRRVAPMRVAAISNRRDSQRIGVGTATDFCSSHLRHINRRNGAIGGFGATRYVLPSKLTELAK